MPWDPNRVVPPNELPTQGDEDPMSPTVMLHKYLAAQGLQPTALNVHNVAMANARGMPVIPGLVNNEPPSGGPSGAAPNAARGGGRGPVANPPMVNLGAGPTNEAAGGPDNTSAQPTQDSGLSLGQIIMGLGGLGAAGAGAYGASRFLRPTPGGSVPPMPDPGAGVPGAVEGRNWLDERRLAGPAEPPRIAGPQPQLALPAPPQAPQAALPPPAPPAPEAPGRAGPSDQDVLAAIRRNQPLPGLSQVDIANAILRNNPGVLQPPHIGDINLPQRARPRVSVEQVPLRGDNRVLQGIGEAARGLRR